MKQNITVSNFVLLEREQAEIMPDNFFPEFVDLIAKEQKLNAVPSILKLEPKIDLSLQDYVILPTFLQSDNKFTFVVIDNNKRSLIAVGNGTKIELDTFLDAAQKYKRVVAMLFLPNKTFTTENLYNSQTVFINTLEECIEYMERLVYEKTSVTAKSKVKEIEKKLKRAVLNQKRYPEKNDFVDVEEGRIRWAPQTKIFVKKGKNVQLRFLIDSLPQQSVSYKWYCRAPNNDDMNVISNGHFLNIQLTEDNLVLLGEATKPDGTIVCTQETEVSASSTIPKDQTLAQLNAILFEKPNNFEYRYKCNIEDIAAEIQEMKPYLISIANSKKDFARPHPHLERHQAFLVIGYGNKFNELETKFLAEELFSPEIKAEVMNSVMLLFKGKAYGKMYDYLEDEAKTHELYNFDSLPTYIRNKRKYVQRVLFYEALTKMVINRESCDHKTATAMALGKDIPCSTPYGEYWKELIETTSLETSKRVTRSYAKANKR